LRKRKPQETQALALASSQLWLLLLRPSIPIGWRLRLLFSRNKRNRQPIEMLGRSSGNHGCLLTQALAFLAVFVYAAQAIAFEWKPGLSDVNCE